MCGIVGLFLKNEALYPELGRLTALILHEMCGRGPDSAGFAALGPSPGAATGAAVDVETVRDRAILRTAADGRRARGWIIENAPDVTILSLGTSIKVFEGAAGPVPTSH